jgi:hypothetical protein
VVAYDSDDNIVLSNEDWEMFERIEKQAIQETTQLRSSSSFPSSSSSSAASLINLTMEAFPEKLTLHSNIIICLRLRAKSVIDDTNQRKKIITSLEEDNKDGSGSQSVTVILSDEWYDLPVKESDLFHVVDISNEENLISSNSSSYHHHVSIKSNTLFLSFSPMVVEITGNCGIFILYPEVLVSPTKIAESCSCIRRGALSNKIKNFGISAPTAIMGNVRHYFIEVRRFFSFLFVYCFLFFAFFALIPCCLSLVLCSLN